MLLVPNALCCSLYKRNCACAGTKFFTHKKVLPTSAGNAQAQLHFCDDQQRAFGISNISNSLGTIIFYKEYKEEQDGVFVNANK